MAGNKKYDDKDPSAEEYEYYEDYDDYDDYEDEYDDYDSFDDEGREEDQYYDDDDEDDDYLEVGAEYDEDEYYFDDEYYEDRPSLGKRLVERVSRPTQVFIISLFIVIAAFVMGWKYIDNRYFQPVDKANNQMQEIVIERNTSTSDIADLLVEQGIIRDKNVFKLYIDLNDKSSKIKAGTYELSSAMTIAEVVDSLCIGANVSNESQFTLVEGKNVDDLLAELKKENLMSDEAAYNEIVTSGTGVTDYYFIKELVEPESEGVAAEGEDQSAEDDYQEDAVTAVADDIYTYDKIERIEGDRKYLLEGYLFPDTYIVYSDATPREITRKMLNQFNNKFTDAYVVRAERMGMTIDDVVTLASIIEREGTVNDFTKISAVFHNRLRAGGWTLDSCATAQYALGTSRLVLDEDEEKQVNPYNTYVSEGLPAGPICNPSAEAIRAALYPDEELMKKGEEFMFFCLTDPETKEQFFSQTIEEHNAKVAEWKPRWMEYDALYAK